MLSDVKWSLDRAREQGDRAASSSSCSPRSPCVDAQGDDTVMLHLAHPDPDDAAGAGDVQRRHHAGEAGDGGAGRDLEDKSKSVRRSPDRLRAVHADELVAQQRDGAGAQPVLLEAGADGKPLPYLDAIRFVIIPDDATRILKLKAGEIDAAEFVPYSRVAELKADPKLNMVLFPAAQVNYFTINNRPTLKDGTKNPLSDVRVRQALNYATDKEALIQVVDLRRRHAGSRASCRCPRRSPTATGPLYPYDSRRRSSCWRRPAIANGFDVTCMALAGSADDVAKAAALQQMWAQLGVR